jgi:hypothetical protein
MSRATQRRWHRIGTARIWWTALAVIFVAGIVLWLFGVAWGAPLPAVSLLGFVVRAWLDTAPQGGHVHDTGLSAYGVSEAPRITPDQP